MPSCQPRDHSRRPPCSHQDFRARGKPGMTPRTQTRTWPSRRPPGSIGKGTPAGASLVRICYQDRQMQPGGQQSKTNREQETRHLPGVEAPPAPTYHPLQEPLHGLARWAVAYRRRDLLHQYRAVSMAAASRQRNRPLAGGMQIPRVNPRVRQLRPRLLILVDRVLVMATRTYLL